MLLSPKSHYYEEPHCVHSKFTTVLYMVCGSPFKILCLPCFCVDRNKEGFQIRSNTTNIHLTATTCLEVIWSLQAINMKIIKLL